jgi:hypothetical protein
LNHSPANKKCRCGDGRVDISVARFSPCLGDRTRRMSWKMSGARVLGEAAPDCGILARFAGKSASISRFSGPASWRNRSS